MTITEQREAARQFIMKWRGHGNEKQESQSYWIDLLSVLGIDKATDYVQFERPVTVNGQQKYIDAYLPSVRVMVEMKSVDKDLAKPEPQSGGIMLTPYQQAKRYANHMPLDEMPRYIVACNFKEIWVYDQNKPGEDPEIITLDSLQDSLTRLDFLVKKEHASVSEEKRLSIEAGLLVGKIHDRFLEQYNDPLATRTQRSLNILCVRLVFLLYAEDAGHLGHPEAFTNYIRQYHPKDIRTALIELFKVLDTPLDERADLYLSDELAAFPYINGGLFADENIVIPKITEELKTTLLDSAAFDWSKISPTIFGAVFESTLNPETRRAGGMHYTSIENIHKVIDPLFLDDLRSEMAEIDEIAVPAVKKKKLNALQDKMASLKFLDPACGSGNFLTESYLSLRRIENEIIRQRVALNRKMTAGQITLGLTDDTKVKVSIQQFYGIEINDFACKVAQSALWIAESQMLKETEDILFLQMDYFPLQPYNNIKEGNALQMDWNKVVPATELSYIMGNPPFVGKKEQTKQQKTELLSCFNTKGVGNLDYVCGWYAKAIEYIAKTMICCAFVSTNSITQGEQVPILWSWLLNNGIVIDFAYKTFRWDNEANLKAHVHCVIIGFSQTGGRTKYIFEGNHKTEAKNISPYLIDSDNIIVYGRSKSLCDIPVISYGSMPIDNNHLILKPDEYQSYQIEKDYNPLLIRKYIGGDELINNKCRYCIWLKDVNPSEYRHSPFIMNRLTQTKQFRLSSKRPQTIKAAETPQLFGEIRQPSTVMLVIPKVSSENRRYIPIAFVSPDIIVNGSALIIPDATNYIFGILMSNIHNSWMRMVAGRMKSDYQYSASNVYNTFPWPSPTDTQKKLIEATAQGILDARALYPDSSLADLYDPLTMPPELRKAHSRNDAAVMQAYGFDVKTMTEEDCVAELMKLYQKKVEELEGK